MLKSLFVYGVLGAVLLIPAQCDLITVCLSNRSDLRMDCLVNPTAGKMSNYEFSWSVGSKETLIITNASDSAIDAQLHGKSHVEELKPHGYRMTLKGIVDKLPLNATYLCKISGVPATVSVESNKILTCSAASVFLQGFCSWMAGLLLLLYHTHA